MRIVDVHIGDHNEVGELPPFLQRKGAPIEINGVIAEVLSARFQTFDSLPGGEQAFRGVGVPETL